MYLSPSQVNLLRSNKSVSPTVFCYFWSFLLGNSLGHYFEIFFPPVSFLNRIWIAPGILYRNFSAILRIYLKLSITPADDFNFGFSFGCREAVYIHVPVHVSDPCKERRPLKGSAYAYSGCQQYQQVPISWVIL